MLTNPNPALSTGLAIDQETYDRVVADAVTRGKVAYLQPPEATATSLIKDATASLFAVAERKAPLLNLPPAVASLTQGIRAIFSEQMTPSSSTAGSFRPQREGLTSAARALVTGKQRQPLKAGALLFDSAVILRTADELDVLHLTADDLRAAADDIDTSAATKEDALYKFVQEGTELLAPIAKRDAALRTAFAPAFGYRGARYEKGVVTRRANATRDEATIEAVRADLTEEVRADVTAEVVRTMASSLETATPPAPRKGPVRTTASATPAAARTGRRAPGRGRTPKRS